MPCFISWLSGVGYKAGERPWGRKLLGAQYFAGSSVYANGTRP